MRTVSAIYQKVRHRLVDDWAFGNGESAGGGVGGPGLRVGWRAAGASPAGVECNR